jgi:membrane-associated protein
LELIHAILHLDQFLNIAVGQYGVAIYLILFAIVFSETAILMLFFLPGDPLIFISGALSATGEIHYSIVILVLFLAAVFGSNLNYWLGGLLGKKMLENNYKWLNRSALETTHGFYEKHGAITFLVSLFIPIYRTFAPFIAGFTEMTYRKFQFYSTAGAAIWVLTLTSLGYFFGNIPFIRQHLNTIVLLGVGFGVGVPLIHSLFRYTKDRYFKP